MNRWIENLLGSRIEVKQRPLTYPLLRDYLQEELRQVHVLGDCSLWMETVTFWPHRWSRRPRVRQYVVIRYRFSAAVGSSTRIIGCLERLNADTLIDKVLAGHLVQSAVGDARAVATRNGGYLLDTPRINKEAFFSH